MVAIEALTAEGSTIVIPMPAYPRSRRSTQATRRPAVYVPTGADGFDLDALEHAFTSTANTVWDR